MIAVVEPAQVVGPSRRCGETSKIAKGRAPLSFGCSRFVPAGVCPTDAAMVHHALPSVGGAADSQYRRGSSSGGSTDAFRSPRSANSPLCTPRRTGTSPLPSSLPRGLEAPRKGSNVAGAAPALGSTGQRHPHRASSADTGDTAEKLRARTRLGAAETPRSASKPPPRRGNEDDTFPDALNATSYSSTHGSSPTCSFDLHHLAVSSASMPANHASGSSGGGVLPAEQPVAMSGSWPPGNPPLAPVRPPTGPGGKRPKQASGPSPMQYPVSPRASTVPSPQGSPTPPSKPSPARGGNPRNSTRQPRASNRRTSREGSPQGPPPGFTESAPLSCKWNLESAAPRERSRPRGETYDFLEDAGDFGTPRSHDYQEDL